MHEASIAYSLLQMLLEIGEKERAREIRKAVVKVGKLSGVVPECLSFAFDAMKTEYSKTENTRLVIVEVPLTYLCRRCGKTFTREDFIFPECPFCSSAETELIKGEELDLEEVECEV